MSELTLGLDIGPNSIGWSMGDQAGVRIFPEGVDRDQQGGEKSKSQSRRDSRGMRRQIARRALRNRHLREWLAESGLLPADPLALDKVLEQNPYGLRRQALDQKLEPFQIGRILLHLSQRRGFLSNRKTDKKKDDTKGMLAEIGELDEAIKSSGSRTLGEYLAKLDADFQHKSATDDKKVRSRHTRRDMYQHEFEEIWNAQQKHHPDLLTDQLKYGTKGKQDFPKVPVPLVKQTNLLNEYGVYGILFFQRKMYWPKSVVGRCELELKQKRCPKADRAAQGFRILQEVNNLKILDRSTRQERFLTQDERNTVVAYLATTQQRSFEQIRKKLKLHESVQFNFERGERDKLKGHETDALLGSKKGIGKRWKELSENVKDAIVNILIDEEREDFALRYLTDKCGLTREEAEGAMSVNLPDGYMNFCLDVINKLIPHLRRGLMLMADDESNSALHAAGYLRPDEREVNQRRFLPQPPELPNPIVRQAIFEVRKLVNALLREYVYKEGHSLESIHVELAREAKKSFDQRQEIRFENAKRRRERERAATNIVEQGNKPTRATINRFLLWEEQQEYCVYCGKTISQAQLFNGDADVDHILPRWRSLDDSMANKVVCHRSCNSDKGDRTPREWLEESDPQRYEMVLGVIKRLPYNKQRKFQQRDIQLTDFVERQLRDTAYISRCVSQYLRCLGTKIICPRGQMTAELRHWWGLNTILSADGRGEKNRADHRHHAIDATVLALTDEKRLFALANAKGENMPVPWKGFRADVARAISNINVSHRTLRGISGALHEATFYGPTQKNTDQEGSTEKEDRPWAKDWTEQDHAYVRRKPVAELKNTKHLAKVRDLTIRDILKQHLRQMGVDPEKPGKIPGDAFKGENTPRMPSGVPIKKVRMLEESETFRPVSQRRSYQYVKPGNNHHITYRAKGEGDNEKWTAEVVTMWDAAKRAKNGKPTVDTACKSGERFIMSLSIGEMFELDGDDGEILLCVVRKMDQRSKRVHYKLHIDAREATLINKDNLYLSPKNMQERNARKVTVDPLGRIRSAND